MARHLGCSQRPQRSLDRVVGAAHHGRHLPLGSWEQPNLWAPLPLARASFADARLGLVPFGGRSPTPEASNWVSPSDIEKTH